VWALDLFQALDGRRRVEGVDPVASVEARLFLGEVLFVLGRRDEARAIFEALLSENPDTKMSLLEHDPEVIDLFEVVRASIPGPIGPEPPVLFDIPRRPRSWILPFGIPQALAGDDRGWPVQLAGQGGCGTLALSSYLLHRTWIGTSDVRQQDLALSVTLKAVNYASHACFIAFYVGSQVRATRTWRERHIPKVMLGPTGVRAEF
jgi:hypothetical protein